MKWNECILSFVNEISLGYNNSLTAEDLYFELGLNKWQK